MSSTTHLEHVYCIPCQPMNPSDLLHERQYKDYTATAGSPQQQARLQSPARRELQQQQQGAVVEVGPWHGAQLVYSLAAGDEAACSPQLQHLAEPRTLAPRPDDPTQAKKSRPRVMWCSGGVQVRWIIDIFCISSVAVLFLLVEFGWVPGVQTGFYCDDPSIAYRYDGDTIRIHVLLLVSFLVPLLAMWVVESGCCFCPAVAVGARAKRGLRHAWVWYREYLLGLVFTLLVVDVGKVIVGEPRPHFLDSCKPDVALDPASCKAAASPSGYVENFKCTNKELSKYIVNDSTRSFPSGHAAVAVYGALFLIWFLQRRMPAVPSNTPSLYLRPWLQSLCVVWAMVCAFTRISDHRHHPHDVAVGALLGALVAALLIRNYCGGFWPGQCPTRLQEESTSAGEYSTSGERGAVDGEEERGRENGHATGRHPHQSMRRLLSSTSSYSGSITCNDEPSREVNPA